MDMEENNIHDLGEEMPYKARGPARASQDEDSASYIRPIIKELIHTKICFPNIKLLVDRISIVKVPSATESSSLEAYRMYLTDREKTIQAVVKRHLHKWLTTFDVREGSYVVLREYDLAKGKRLHGDGDVFYLAISDFYSVGEEQRYNPSAYLENVSAIGTEGISAVLEEFTAKDEVDEAMENRTERSLPWSSPPEAYQNIPSSKDSISSGSANVESKKRKRKSPSLDSDSDLLSLASKAQKLDEIPSAKMTKGKGHDDDRQTSSDHRFSSCSTPNIPLPHQDSKQASASFERAPSPLQLSTLASVTGNHATRNKQINVLAMIEYVSSSTVKPTTAPLKRDVRIVDPSTDKKVTLSVFVDPVNFFPKQYDIMLFRNLTTHDFSGGNLNAYPQKCKGKEWYVLDPYGTEGCDMRSMELFRANYQKTKARGPK